MKRAISFSLYGSDLRYLIGAIKNSILACDIYPDFEIRFYIGASVPLWVRQTLALNPQVRIIEMDKPENFTAMLWRFLVFSDQSIDMAHVRDVDSRFTYREADAVKAWEESGKDFHIMKDHPTGHNYVLSGGMFGARCEALRDMQELIEQSQLADVYMTDMNFLAYAIYPRASQSMLIHSSVDDQEGKPFPIKKTLTLAHVGAALDENDRYFYPSDRELSERESGVERFPTGT